MKLKAKTQTKQVVAKLKKLDKTMSRDTLAGAVMEGGMIVQREAVNNITTRYDPDIVDLGELRDSVDNQLKNATHNYAEAVQGTNVEHGEYQELGTMYIAARPWLRPAIDENRDKIVRAERVYLTRRLATV